MSRAGFVSHSRAGWTEWAKKVSCPQQQGLELVVREHIRYLVSGPLWAKWFVCKGGEVGAYYMNQDGTPDRARNRR